jgi:hypothetical protein
MRLVLVARVRNEDDLVEAFLRHNLRIADHAVILDDGSTDRTPEILASLQAEGLALTLLRSRSVTFAEAAHNTALFRRAAVLGADWVLCLDCDEFIDTRELDAPLRETLASLGPETVAVAAQLVQYHPTGVGDGAEICVPLRLRHREEAPTGIPKVFVRGTLARVGVTIAEGNHFIRFDGADVHCEMLPGLHLAHFFQRSGWQSLAKSVIGRLKVLATAPGRLGETTAAHYTELLGHLRARPEELLFNDSFLQARLPPELISGGLVHDPIEYLGGRLRYTVGRDPRVHAALSLLEYAELLAARHARLQQTGDAARDATDAWDVEIAEV